MRILLLILSLFVATNGLASSLISVDDAVKLLGKPGVQFVSTDAKETYTKGHIKGSSNTTPHDLHYLDDVLKCGGLPMCEDTAFKIIGKLGIDQASQVIVYDDGRGANASGIWFFLKLYGVKNVKVLDGGFATWAKKKHPIAKGSSKVAAKKYSGTVDKSMIATVSEVEKATKDASKYVILDSRHNFDEYIGKKLNAAYKTKGVDVTVARGGFIPTAIFSPWTKYAGNKSGKAGKPIFKSAKKLKKQLSKLKKKGYDKKKTVISYCHLGLGRGTFQYMALKEAGHEDVKVYIGSWNEWGNSSRPVGKLK